MIRRTRHGSVCTKARRSADGIVVSSRSSSVTAVRCESGECCDMVVLHVVEEGRKADVPGTGVCHNRAGGEMAHRGRRISGREHHDRRAVLRRRGDLGPKALIARACYQIFYEPRGDPPDREHPDLLDVLESAELRVDRRQGGSAQLEAPRILMEFERPRLEGEL